MRLGTSLLVAALGMAMVSACSMPVIRPAVVVVGPSPQTEPEVLWARVLEALRAQRYEPEQLDPARGTFMIPAHSSQRVRSFFVVQVYSDGFVSLRAFGGLIRPAGAQLVAEPPQLVAEHDALAMWLREVLVEGRSP
jgi:hypothetical protein